ncbi:MAG: molybdopterin-dependent oxidoreductase [Pseudomonadales bacterium]
MNPPGQRIRADFPRFGLPAYAQKFPSSPNDRSIVLELNGIETNTIEDALAGLPRTTMRTDFHCVTTWTYSGAEWGGIRFKEFFQKHVQPLGTEATKIAGAVFYAQDGYRTTLLLEDLLQEDVMLADTLDGQPLSIEHGAPLRLVAPALYSYKNLKHLTKIEFYSAMPVVKRGMSAFLDHPRGRVEKEERGRWVPGLILRYVYHRLIPRTEDEFRQAMDKHEA